MCPVRVCVCVVMYVHVCEVLWHFKHCSTQRTHTHAYTVTLGGVVSKYFCRFCGVPVTLVAIFSAATAREGLNVCVIVVLQCRLLVIVRCASSFYCQCQSSCQLPIRLSHDPSVTLVALFLHPRAEVNHYPTNGNPLTNYSPVRQLRAHQRRSMLPRLI